MENFFKYLQVNQDYCYGELIVHNAGHTRIEPGSAYPPGRHPDHHWFSFGHGRVMDEYQLIYITEGKGVLHTRSGGKYPITEGDGFFLFPGEWHSYRPEAETGWTENWVGFKGEVSLLACTDYLVSRFNPVFRIGLDDRLIQLFNSVFQTAKSDHTASEFVLSGLVHLLIGHVLTRLKRDKLNITNRTDEIIMKAKTLMESRFSSRISLLDLASELNISYVWFRTSFRKHTGFSPYDYLLNIRINHARLLLKSSSMSVKEVSQASGFESQQQFSRTFRKRTGMTPLEFRRA